MPYPEFSVSPGELQGTDKLAVPRSLGAPTVKELLPSFAACARYQWNLTPKSVRCYVQAMERALKVLPDVTPADITAQHVVALREDLARAGVSLSWTRIVLNGLKGFLRFCAMELGLEVLPPQSIRLPRMARREVEYLTSEEVEKFVGAIPVFGKGGRIQREWLMVRALVEVLVGTGMRITEALDVKTADLDMKTGEAKIMGKGNRPRTVFFTPRSLSWVKEYLNRRGDREYLFTGRCGERLCYEVLLRYFKIVRGRAGIPKKITPHILRHTCATILLFNGCPIGHIKEVLGHQRLITTCQYYLGTDKKAAKDAHQKFLRF